MGVYRCNVYFSGFSKALGDALFRTRSPEDRPGAGVRVRVLAQNSATRRGAEKQRWRDWRSVHKTQTHECLQQAVCVFYLRPEPVGNVRCSVTAAPMKAFRYVLLLAFPNLGKEEAPSYARAP